MRSSLLLSAILSLLPAVTPPAVTGPPIRVFPAIVQPAAPAPQPMPSSLGASKLTVETLCMSDSDVPLLVLCSPAGMVKVTAEEGPINKVRGVFINGNGKRETRSFPGKFVYTIEPLKSGACELFFLPLAGVKDETEVTRRLLDVDTGEPIIVKPVDPVTPVKPAPDALPAGKKLFVKVVAETLTWPVAQADMLADVTLRANLKALVGTELEILRPDSKEAADMGLPPFVAEAGGAPCLIVLDADGATKGLRRLAVPLPLTGAGVMTAVNKLYGK